MDELGKRLHCAAREKACGDARNELATWLGEWSTRHKLSLSEFLTLVNEPVSQTLIRTVLLEREQGQ